MLAELLQDAPPVDPFVMSIAAGVAAVIAVVNGVLNSRQVKKNENGSEKRWDRQERENERLRAEIGRLRGELRKCEEARSAEREKRLKAEMRLEFLQSRGGGEKTEQ